MKTTEVNKLYKQLTPTELANLGIAALTRSDNKEFSLIVGSVERVAYDCPHADYTRHLQGFERLAFIYGVEYWKSFALLLMAAHAGDSESLKAGGVFISKLASMEKVLTDTCTALQLDIEAVKWLADCKDSYAPINSGSESPEWINHYTELFGAAVKCAG